MAVITHKRSSQLFTDYILGNSGSVVPPASWTMGLSSVLVSAMARDSVWSVTVSGTNINELGSTTPAGYARQTIARSIAQGAIDWGTSTYGAGTGQTTVADEVTFGAFTGAGPNPNGAKSWTLTDGSTLNAGNPYVSGDTAATRTFAVGDTEKVTPTIQVG